jgi:hypothetical protein
MVYYLHRELQRELNICTAILVGLQTGEAKVLAFFGRHAISSPALAMAPPIEAGELK